MSENLAKNLARVIRTVGKYPRDAFEFLQCGLDHTVRSLHGSPGEGLHELHQWLQSAEIEPGDLAECIERGEVPDVIVDFVETLGGIEAAAKQLNRHVSGEDLCWGLREFALRRWGPLASTVLRRWGIVSTRDFGTMVFALVEGNIMQKQPDDCIEDFEGVYDFATALDGPFEIGAWPMQGDEADSE